MDIIALMNACTLRYNFSCDRTQSHRRFFGIKLLPGRCCTVHVLC